MSAAFVVLMLLFAVLVPLALWVAIENETSNTTVVDRADAERIAKERGGRGRGGSRSNPSASETGADSSASDREHTIADRTDDDRNTTAGWGTPREERGTNSLRSVEQDETRDDRHR